MPETPGHIADLLVARRCRLVVLAVEVGGRLGPPKRGRRRRGFGPQPARRRATAGRACWLLPRSGLSPCHSLSCPWAGQTSVTGRSRRWQTCWRMRAMCILWLKAACGCAPERRRPQLAGSCFSRPGTNSCEKKITTPISLPPALPKQLSLKHPTMHFHVFSTFTLNYAAAVHTTSDSSHQPTKGGLSVTPTRTAGVGGSPMVMICFFRAHMDGYEKGFVGEAKKQEKLHLLALSGHRMQHGTRTVFCQRFFETP